MMFGLNSNNYCCRHGVKGVLFRFVNTTQPNWAENNPFYNRWHVTKVMVIQKSHLTQDDGYMLYVADEHPGWDLPHTNIMIASISDKYILVHSGRDAVFCSRTLHQGGGWLLKGIAPRLLLWVDLHYITVRSGEVRIKPVEFQGAGFSVWRAGGGCGWF